MLAPLVIDLLMTCTLFLLTGWAYDSIGRWFEAERPLAGSVVRGAFGHRREAKPSIFPRPAHGLESAASHGTIAARSVDRLARHYVRTAGRP